jgi:hypothetical protein
MTSAANPEEEMLMRIPLLRGVFDRTLIRPLQRIPAALSVRRDVGLPAGAPEYVRTRMAAALPLRPRC